MSASPNDGAEVKHLRLLKDGPPPEQPLLQLIRENGGLVPEDLDVINMLSAHTYTHATLSNAVTTGLEAGALLRVFIGSVAHLRMGSNKTSVTAHAQTQNAPAKAEESAQALFQLRLAIDAEHERALLYRCAAVGLTILGLVILRGHFI